MIARFGKVKLPSELVVNVPILLDWGGRECIRWTDEKTGEKIYLLIYDGEATKLRTYLEDE